METGYDQGGPRHTAQTIDSIIQGEWEWHAFELSPLFFCQFLSTVMYVICCWLPWTTNIPATTLRIMASLFRGSHCLWCPSGNPCFPEGRPRFRASCSQFHTYFLPVSLQNPASCRSQINCWKTPRSSVKTRAGSLFLLWTPQDHAALCVGFFLYLIGEEIVLINKGHWSKALLSCPCHLSWVHK